MKKKKHQVPWLGVQKKKKQLELCEMWIVFVAVAKRQHEIAWMSC